jgi:hypothetical protein
MKGVAVPWESVMPAVTQNCDSECSFGNKDAINTEQGTWIELQG